MIDDCFVDWDKHSGGFHTPPIIGCLISDKDGKNFATFEIFHNALHHFIIGDEEINESFSPDLIPMYTSALELLSKELHIKNLPGIEIKGSNIKLHIIFNFEKFTVILFLNPSVDFNKLEALTKNYLSNLFEEFNEHFRDCKEIDSSEFIQFVERIGWNWLLDLNYDYVAV
jgi:hypothetical protein